MTRRPIYMDHHATTPVDPAVVEAMLPFLKDDFGNAASVNHAYGWRAAEAVERAREQVAELLGCESREILFTSGATESNNLALKGVLRAAGPGAHLVLNAAEHKAVIDPAKRLEKDGYDVTVLPVDRHGRVDPQDVANSLRENTALISVMSANNEVGTINPIVQIGDLCREAGVPFHTDATQAVGVMPMRLADSPIDLLSLSAHKLYGPKGIGALFVRKGARRVRLEPQIDGGGHERRLRSGTLPVHQIVGFGVACSLCRAHLATEPARIAALRDRLRDGLHQRVDDITVNGHPEQRLPGNLHVSFHGINGEALLVKLKDLLAASYGAACTTADPEPSHVLRAMGLSEGAIESSLRFGLGRFNSEDEVDTVVEAIASAVVELRRSAAKTQASLTD